MKKNRTIRFSPVFPPLSFLIAAAVLLLPSLPSAAEAAEAVHTVVICSRLEGQSSSFAPVSGGGSYAASEGADLLAADQSGFTFAGWYENYSEASDGTLVSSEKSVHVSTESDRFLTAVYRPDIDVSFTVTVAASGFTVTGQAGSLSGASSRAFAAGTEVTVSFTDESEQFICWQDGNGQLVSGSEDFTFTAARDCTLTALSVPEGESFGEALVTFTDENGHTISAVRAVTAESIVFPEAPPVSGRVFTGWDMTEEEIRRAMYSSDLITVQAQYRNMSALTVSQVFIPGTDTVLLKAGTKSQSVCFRNPSQNECWFRTALCLSDGTLLWESALFGPGEESDPVVLSEELPKGYCSGAKLLYCCYMPDRCTELDRAELTVSLAVD